MQIELNWLPPLQGPPEIAHTSAGLQIRFGDQIATRFEDEWSQSVQQRIRVSAYPLALWFASSWWRLRWEPDWTRGEMGAADSAWRMSHELPAAGHGFIWPRLIFASDGESLGVRCLPSDPRSPEPVRFLSGFETIIPASAFETAIDGFLDLVLHRLDGRGETDLHRLWAEVLAERRDPAQAIVRRLEARLGFDPDEAPASLLLQFLELGEQVGIDAADEIAAVCSSPDPGASFAAIQDLATHPGIPARIALPASPSVPVREHLPWERGQRLAQWVREFCDWGTLPLSDQTLGDLLAIDSNHLLLADQPRQPIGLAVRSTTEGHLKLLFSKRNRPARRFEAARFIAGHLCANEKDHWLPVSGTATARQKVQRAFAAELLCPIQALRDFLQGDFGSDAFEEAADHFGVSDLLIKTHLANHKLIPRSAVTAETSWNA